MKKNYRSFEEAREFARSLGLKGKNKWREWCKSGERPEDIPTDPGRTYKEFGWAGWGDFLGTGVIATQNRQYRSFEEAREFARSLGLKGREEWNEWSKSGKRPEDIPAKPNKVYKEFGWAGWGDFLGTDNKASKDYQFYSFEEAREFARSLGLKGKNKWREWCKSGERPEDIPTDPGRTYKEFGWAGWGDFLGTGNISNVGLHKSRLETARSAVAKIQSTCFLSYMDKFDNILLYQLFKLTTNPVLKKTLKPIIESPNKTKAIEDVQAELKAEIDKNVGIDDSEEVTEENVDDITLDPTVDVEDAAAEPDTESSKPKDVNVTIDIINNKYDIITECFGGNKFPAELEEWFWDNAVKELLLGSDSLQKILDTLIENLNRAENEKNKYKYETLIRRIELMLPEFMSFPTPSDENFANGKYSFNMMQKMFAYGVKTKRYYGNWSGTGVGKTISFILASRVIDSRLTVVVGVNSTVGQLGDEIKKLYNDSQVYYVSPRHVPKSIDYGKHNYFIINYEKGQQTYSESFFNKIHKDFKVDYIVFDEVQMIKSSAAETSRRSKIFKDFRNNCVQKYDSHVSVLSATPFVNNIREVVSILKMLTGKDYSDIDLRNRLTNAYDCNIQLGLDGIRCMAVPTNENNKKLIFKETTAPIQADRLFDDFCKSYNKGPLECYKSTLPAKLEWLKSYLSNHKEFTIIYTQFVDEIQEEVVRALKGVGIRVAVYTGKTKDTEHLKRRSDNSDDTYVDWSALAQEYDVLLASQTIATGVDGLQKISRKEILLTLPWTNALYEQLRGRVYRQGSKFDSVEVIVPLVKFSQFPNNIGYDDKVWMIINNKKTFSAACMDGEFPGTFDDNVHNKVVKEITESLNDIKNKIINSEVRPFEFTIEREAGETEEAYQERVQSELERFHKQVRTSSIEKTKKMFADNPEKFANYHAHRNVASSKWSEQPWQVCAEYLKDIAPRKVIGDFGCGDDAKIMKFLRSRNMENKVWSFDLKSANSDVILCDIRDTREYLEDGAIDYAIYSLALWGLQSERREVLTEAFRVLDHDGKIIMAVTVGEEEQVKGWLEEIGFNGVRTFKKNKFAYLEGVKN